MQRGFLICATVSLGLTACGTDATKRAAAPPSSGSKIVFSSARASNTVPRADLGRLIGEAMGLNVMVDTEGPALGRSMVRTMAYLARSNGAATEEARNTFSGSGESVSDLMRPAKRPINTDTDYTELLYGNLAARDPGGVVEHVEFYEDDNGCETDVVTRRGKDGRVRVYFIDTTGWHDKTLEESGNLPTRNCTR